MKNENCKMQSAKVKINLSLKKKLLFFEQLRNKYFKLENKLNLGEGCGDKGKGEV